MYTFNCLYNEFKLHLLSVVSECDFVVVVYFADFSICSILVILIVLLMQSNHYPATLGRERRWL